MLLLLNQPCSDDTARPDAARLEQPLWNDQNVARTESDVAFDVTISDQAVEMDGVGILLALRSTDDHAVVPRRIFGQTADCDHHIEERHVSAIRERAGLRSFTDDPDLFGYRADKAFHNDRYERFLDIFRKSLLKLAGKRGGCLADRHDVLDQRYREPAVGTYRDRERQLGVAPDKDVQSVARTDAVLGRGERRGRWRRR